MSKFSQFAVNKRAFNNINENRCPLFSQINFDQTHSGGYCPGVFVLGIYFWGFMSGRDFLQWVYVPEPYKIRREAHCIKGVFSSHTFLRFTFIQIIHHWRVSTMEI